MANKWLPCILLALTACTGSADKSNEGTGSSGPEHDLIRYVDPFIGTGFHGHTFPGPSMPHGLVQPGPDTHLMGWDASSGYHYGDSTIYGFSHTHLSGTGIGDMGDVLVLPFTGPLDKTTDRKNLPLALFDHGREKAAPGYYEVEFDNYRVTAQLTASDRVGMHRYRYGPGSEKLLLVDLGHILQADWGHANVLNRLELVDQHTLRGLKHSTGWSHDHQAFFRMEFSSPCIIRQVVSDEREIHDGDTFQGKDLWAILQFTDLREDEPLLVKVSISPVDTEGARMNMEEEVPHWDFDQVLTQAEEAWRAKLGKIRISAMDPEQYTIFYTALYHAMMAPSLYQDADGRYRGMDGKIHQAGEGETNYTAYSLWDTFRALHPLMTLIDEPLTVQWAKNLLMKYRQGGFLPKWPLATSYTGTMIGYPAVAFLSDVLAKEIPGVDPELALEAALRSASWQAGLRIQPENPRAQQLMPLHNYYVNSNRHIPADKVSGSVSYGLEMSYYDWCIARLAAMLGKDSLEMTFRERSGNYRRYFDPESGFMRARNADGSWIEPFNPRYSDHENSPYIEGNAWQWSWFVPHDPDGLMELHGGAKGLEIKLDSLFTTSSVIEGENASGDITGLIGQYAHGNEPSHHVAYLYVQAGVPWKTQALVDSILYSFYTDKPEGIIGNEDCGQMSAWYLLSAMGIYQIAPGSPVWTIGRPIIHEAEIEVAPGRIFTIRTTNNSRENRYVQEVKLNGRKREDLYLHHREIIRGGVLEIVMGSQPAP